MTYGDSLFTNYGTQGPECSFVYGASDIAVGERVGEGMYLELKPYFHYVEGRDAEASENWSQLVGLESDCLSFAPSFVCLPRD